MVGSLNPSGDKPFRRRTFQRDNFQRENPLGQKKPFTLRPEESFQEELGKLFRRKPPVNHYQTHLVS